MEIAVLLKQTFDTEEKVVLKDGRIEEQGVKYIVNPYDEYAVEAALQIREQHGGTVYVVSAGPPRAEEALRTALAMGADEAVLIDDAGARDEHAIAQLLAAYVSKRGADIVLAGNFSVDNGAAQTAIRVAELLGIPHYASLTSLQISEGKAYCERDAEGDTEMAEVTLPALFTAQQGLCEPRYPSLAGIMKAKRKPFTRLTANDLGIETEQLQPKVLHVGLTLPAARGSGRMLEGNVQEQVEALLQQLRTHDKVL